MTWIQAPENYQRIAPVKENTPEAFDEPVEFNDNGTAHVKDDIAQYLISEYDMITEHQTEETEE